MYRILGNVDAGSQAPDFRARDVLGRDFNLADYRGRNNLVLFFYRNSQCQTCREELTDLADRYPLISEQDGEVLAISTDGIDVAKNMAVDLHLPYPVISDPDGNIIKLYGVYDGDMDTAYPAVLLIDKMGVVRFRKVIESLEDLVPATEVVNKLKDMGAMHGKEPFKSSRFR
ncbi:MAG TPA: peroxiredoxin family protein [Methanocella sp.]|jgi:peroxiredoxin Q/BCP